MFAAAAACAAISPDACAQNRQAAAGSHPLPGVVRCTNNVFLMENHQVAYAAWHSAGVTSGIVVHVDAHEDCRFVPDDKVRRAKSLADSGAWEELHALSDMDGYFRYSTKQETLLFDLGNFLYPCIRDGTLSAVWWVIPNKSIEPECSERLKRHLRGALRLESLPNLSEDGSNGFHFSISNVSFSVTTLGALPRLQKGTLLDVDADFFAFASALSDDHLAGSLQWDPETVLQILADRAPDPAVVTIASSVWGGYLPLSLRFLPDAVFDRFANGAWPSEARTLRKALEALHDGRPDDATNALSEVGGAWEPARLHMEGLAALIRGAPEIAAGLFEEAARREPVYCKAFLDAAETLLAMERTADAERMIERFEAFYGCRTTMADAARARTAIRKGDFPLADELTSRLLAWERTSHALMLRGGLLTEMGRLDEAGTLYREVLARDPNKAGIVHYNLGVLAEKRGRQLEALELFDAAIQALPSFADAHEHMGHILLLRGNLEKAAESFERALRFSPARVTALNNLGLAMLRQKKFEDAAVSFRKALAINPSLAEAHYNLGLALAAIGSADEAAEHYEAALRIRPDFEQAKKALENMKRNEH